MREGGGRKKWKMFGLMSEGDRDGKRWNVIWWERRWEGRVRRQTTKKKKKKWRINKKKSAELDNKWERERGRKGKWRQMGDDGNQIHRQVNKDRNKQIKVRAVWILASPSLHHLCLHIFRVLSITSIHMPHWSHLLLFAFTSSFPPPPPPSNSILHHHYFLATFPRSFHPPPALLSPPSLLHQVHPLPLFHHLHLLLIHTYTHTPSITCSTFPPPVSPSSTRQHHAWSTPSTFMPSTSSSPTMASSASTSWPTPPPGLFHIMRCWQWQWLRLWPARKPRPMKRRSLALWPPPSPCHWLPPSWRHHLKIRVPIG